MGYKRKKQMMKVIKRSVLTGKAIWIGHRRTYHAEWIAYMRACEKEMRRMRQWTTTVRQRKENVMRLLGELTARLQNRRHGDMPQELREATRTLTRLSEETPPRQSDFYDHICEERRRKQSNSNYDK